MLISIEDGSFYLVKLTKPENVNRSEELSSVCPSRDAFTGKQSLKTYNCLEIKLSISPVFHFSSN